MCGIFAIFLNRPLSDRDIELGRAGSAALAHRGPDASGEWIDREAGVFLGHRRLSIIDPGPGSDQPMLRSGTALIFNGEIYNYKELRTGLEGKHAQFVTSGDTEVLFQLLATRQEADLEQIDGMFSFAFWDGRRALLAIDAFGEKPLFWAETDAGICVSSELAPLARLLKSERDLSGEKLSAFLALGYIPAPHTAYRTIHRLSPASFFTIEKGIASKPKRYWKAPRGEPGRGPVQPLSEKELDGISETLTQSLARRLRSDVPLCLFLSRGVDSSLIAALAGRELNTSLHAITIAFPSEHIHSEEVEAARIAAHLGHCHEVIKCEDSEDATGTKTLLNLFGEPNDNVSVFPVQQMAALAARRFKVALGGNGGDELFYGYNKHHYFFRFRHILALPLVLRSVLAMIARPFETIDERAAQFSTVFGLPRSMYYFGNKNYPAGRWLMRAPGVRAFAEALFSNTHLPSAYEVPYFELTDALPNSQLTAMDLGSMQESLELRTPFLSTALLSKVAEFDPRALLAFGQKSVLRRIAGRYLPDELMASPKSGLVFPPSLFVEQAGDEVPLVPGLPCELTQKAWSVRDRGPGWSRIATRLILAATFAAQGP